MSLLMEIGRRKVSQVAAVYAVVAWLIIQVVDVVSGPLNLPDWFAPVTIVFLGIGFPIALILAWIIDKTPQGMVVDQGAPRVETGAPASSQRISFALQGLVLLAVGFLVVDQFLLDSTPQGSITSQARSVAPSSLSRRFQIDIGPTEPFGGGSTEARISLTADGRHLAHATQTNGVRRLHLRDFVQDALREIRIADSDGIGDIYISPDGEWLAYQTTEQTELRRVSVTGGASQIFADNRLAGTGIAWLSDGSVITTLRNAQNSGTGLHKIATPGAEPELLTREFDESVPSYSWPDVLPGEDHLLFTARPRGLNARDGYIGLLALETGEVTKLIDAGYNARYAPSGHIVFLRSGSLWAVPFEPETLATIGEATQILAGIHTSGSRGYAAYGFSDDGLLVYLPGNDTQGSDNERYLVRVDRNGREEDLGAPPENYDSVSVSPDGDRLAVTVNDAQAFGDIGVFDIARRSLDHWATPEFDEGFPVWTHSDDKIIFSRDSSSGNSILSQSSHGGGSPELLFTSTSSLRPEALTPDDEMLLYSENESGHRGLQGHSLDGVASTESVYEPNFGVTGARLSPDGHWLAYTSNETGQDEVYVRPFPDLQGSRHKISIGGGETPHWSATGDELFYQSRVSMQSVAITTNPEFSAGQPSILFPVAEFVRTRWDTHPDGGFVMIKRYDQDSSADERSHLVVIENWFDELQRLAPPSTD